jgi:hypothetical protein
VPGDENGFEAALARESNRDRERATRYLARAVALPYDDVERTQPIAWESPMALFMAVADEAELDERATLGWTPPSMS